MRCDVFLSYTRIKNQYDQRINGFRDRLENELRQKSGDVGMTVFQDARDLAAGQEWPSEIDLALGKARVLLVLFSPTWINSPQCRREFAVFRAAGRRKTVIPVVWDEVREAHARSSDAAKVFAAIAKIHTIDWSTLKTLPWSDTRARKAFASLGDRIAHELTSSPSVGKSPAAGRRIKANTTAETGRIEQGNRKPRSKKTAVTKTAAKKRAPAKKK